MGENPEIGKGSQQFIGFKTGAWSVPEDSWWLAHLLRHAMIRGSFLPPRAIEELRDLTRRRKKLLSADTEPHPELRRKQQREDQIQHHIRRLRQLGVQVPTPEGASDLGSPAPLKGNRPRSPEAPGFHAR
jgi:hypothetical protein